MYPLKFKPIYKEKIWGGQKIRSVLNKDFGDLENCGESWDLSGVDGDVSVISNGHLAGTTLKAALQSYGPDLLGGRLHDLFGDQFPLLVKFIDATQDLSIQVHPDDELAKKRHDGMGKSEMWYVVQADEGAKLISGFNQPINREQYLEHFRNGKIMDILNQEEVQQDEVYFLPAGRVHTIGKGLLIAEIQQTSDITYRIYDFDRVDKHVNKRELHTEAALDAIDFSYHSSYKTTYEDVDDARVPLVACKHFITNKLTLNATFQSVPDVDSFKIYTCLRGIGRITGDSGESDFRAGEVVLVPASLERYQVETSEGTTLLESYIS